MPYTASIELAITTEVEALLEQQMQSGRFRDPNELIATALHVLSGTTPQDLSALNREIQQGIELARVVHASRDLKRLI